MPRFFGKVDTIKFERGKMMETNRKQLETHFRSAIKEFIIGALSKVPVDTGMAQGSFLHLSRFLRMGLAVPTKPIKRTDQYYYLRAGLKIPKTPEYGARLSTTPAETIVFDKAKDKITFEFQSKVHHYTLLEFFAVRGKGQWQSYQEGRRRFFEKMKEFKSKIPKIQSFLTRTTISFGPGNRFDKKVKRILLNKQETTR